MIACIIVSSFLCFTLFKQGVCCQRRPYRLVAWVVNKTSPQLGAPAYKDAKQHQRESTHIQLHTLSPEEVWIPSTVDELMITVEIDMHLCSMRLIDVNAFLEREGLIKWGKPVDRRAKVLEFGDDEVTEHAILSHRWIEQEVDYSEVVELAKTAKEERNEIRQRDGCRKILQSCEQAKNDGYKWLWVDTCCIDKRSSAELSEAINSMYRWYENSRICYAYLHDLTGSSFPIAGDYERYYKSKGWPEWFSRGWTLQEMIAPRDVQFFNRYWHPIGDKRTLSPILEVITRVPQHILKEGLSSNRPCVAQIMSWAAYRTTTPVEGRAYSLIGLLYRCLYGVRGGEEGFSSSSAGNHPHVERPKHLRVGLQRNQCAGWQHPRR